MKPLVELARSVLRKNVGDERAFDFVVLQRRGAVQVHVVDVGRPDARARERIGQRQACAEAFRMRCRHVVRVGRFAVADQARRARIAIALDQREAGGLADRDALACGIERTARLRRDELERIETEQHAVAERVDAGEDRGIDDAEPDHALGLGEDLRARRARGRDREARSARAEHGLQKESGRMRRVHYRPAQVCGQAIAVERAIALFGRADARGRSADHERDAIGAVPRDACACAIEESVCDEPMPGQAVVAAVVVGIFIGQRLLLEPVDAADRAGQRHAREIVGLEAAAIAKQRRRMRSAAVAERGCRGEGGEG